MEDPRLSRMYAKLFARDLAKARRHSWIWARSHRPAVVLFGVVLAVVIFAAGYTAHVHGRFRQLKTELHVIGPAPVETTLLPGGQEPVTMERTQLAEGSTPEFLSATLLPGRGLNVLQIMVSIPGRGPTPLLAAPSLEEATKAMTGQDADANGQASLAMGAPLEAPWAGRIFGSRTGDPSRVASDWHGRPLLLPLTGESSGALSSEGGLLLTAGADTVKHNAMPDGGTVQGSFTAGDFGVRWPSKTGVVVSALLSSHVFEIKMVARNEGTEPAPVGLGWRPVFLVPGGGREGLRLRLPAEAFEEVSNGRATGRIVPVVDTPLDYTDRGGRLLGRDDLDRTFVHLRSGFLENGPVTELRDPVGGVGIRVTSMSQQIRAIHVHTRSSTSTVAMNFQTNYDDPFSRVWPREEDTGMYVLEPGRSLQWRIRVELFPLNARDQRPF